VLDLLDKTLNELNLYSHECSTLALMAEALAQHRAPSVTLGEKGAADDDAGGRASRMAVREGLLWEVEQHERRLRELRCRIDALDALEGSAEKNVSES